MPAALPTRAFATVLAPSLVGCRRTHELGVRLESVRADAALVLARDAGRRPVQVGCAPARVDVDVLRYATAGCP